MATSGTVGQTIIQVIDLCEHIARRCGVTPDKLTPESLRILKNVMFFFMTSLSNRGINLWRVQRGLFGLDQGQATYVMPAGTLDIIKGLYRVPEALSASAITSSDGVSTAPLSDQSPSTVFKQLNSGGNVVWDFGGDVTVNLVGLLAGSSTTLDLIFEVSEDALTWTEVRQPGSTITTDGKWMWFNIEPAVSERYFRVREQANGTLAFREVVIAQDWSEIEMYRMSRDDYMGLPNKRFPGEPRQYWFDRQSPTPQLVTWPVADASSMFHLVSVFLHMQCQDVGSLSGEIDIPQRWYDAFVANCAFMAVLDLPGADLNRYQMLKDQAAMTMSVADGEERDNTETKLVPNIRGYTA